MEKFVVIAHGWALGFVVARSVRFAAEKLGLKYDDKDRCVHWELDPPGVLTFKKAINPDDVWGLIEITSGDELPGLFNGLPR